MSENIFFVYVSHNGKLHPQKWIDDKINSETGKPYPCAFKIKLDDKHKGMNLQELVFTFPYSKKALQA